MSMINITEDELLTRASMNYCRRFDNAPLPIPPMSQVIWNTKGAVVVLRGCTLDGPGTELARYRYDRETDDLQFLERAEEYDVTEEEWNALDRRDVSPHELVEKKRRNG